MLGHLQVDLFILCTRTDILLFSLTVKYIFTRREDYLVYLANLRIAFLLKHLFGFKLDSLLSDRKHHSSCSPLSEQPPYENLLKNVKIFQ